MTHPLSEAGTSVELLPCPFCSGAATIVATGVTTNIWAKCLGCGATTSLEGTTVEAAAAAWNRRALIQPTPAETEGVVTDEMVRAAIADFKRSASLGAEARMRSAIHAALEARYD